MHRWHRRAGRLVLEVRLPEGHTFTAGAPQRVELSVGGRSTAVQLETSGRCSGHRADFPSEDGVRCGLLVDALSTVATDRARSASSTGGACSPAWSPPRAGRPAQPCTTGPHRRPWFLRAAPGGTKFRPRRRFEVKTNPHSPMPNFQDTFPLGRQHRLHRGPLRPLARGPRLVDPSWRELFAGHRAHRRARHRLQRTDRAQPTDGHGRPGNGAARVAARSANGATARRWRRSGPRSSGRRRRAGGAGRDGAAGPGGPDDLRVPAARPPARPAGSAGPSAPAAGPRGGPGDGRATTPSRRRSWSRWWTPPRSSPSAAGRSCGTCSPGCAAPTAAPRRRVHEPARLRAPPLADAADGAHARTAPSSPSERAAPHPHQALRRRGLRELPAHQVRGRQALLARRRRDAHPDAGRHARGRRRAGRARRSSSAWPTAAASTCSPTSWARAPDQIFSEFDGPKDPTAATWAAAT